MSYELCYDTWGNEEKQAIQNVIDSGRFTMGPYVEKFEQVFAEKFGSRFAVMTNSGSSANLIAIASLCYQKTSPLQPGDEVLVPAIAWATTYYPLMQYGLKLRFIDVELETLNMDISQLEKALTPQTKALVAVSILGNPCRLDLMRQFCDRHNLLFFEDNCESMGASIQGKACGTFGDIGTFSTFFSHHISTIEGGVCVTDNEELYHLMLAIRSHGWTRHLPSPSPIYQKREEDFFEAYRFIVPGYNVRPIEFSGAVGLEQLKKLDQFVEVRRKNGAIWKALFENDSRFIIQKQEGGSAPFAFTMILHPDLPISRKEVLALLKKEEILFRIITGGNFLRHDVIKYCDYSCFGNMTNADLAHDRGFFIGNHPIDLQKNLEKFHQILDHFIPSCMSL
jgi:CDP-6-deoxy-D-xylo-4-hexulose-3-dehydrase